MPLRVSLSSLVTSAKLTALFFLSSDVLSTFCKRYSFFFFCFFVLLRSNFSWGLSYNFSNWFSLIQTCRNYWNLKREDWSSSHPLPQVFDKCDLLWIERNSGKIGNNEKLENSWKYWKVYHYLYHYYRELNI